jgi:hypothetical protein
MGRMPIDILTEAEAVAEARWRATEPPPGRRQVAPGPPAHVTAADRWPAPARRAGEQPRATAAPRAAHAADEADPWLTRQLLRLDERLLAALAVLAMLALLGATVLTALATR